MLKAVCAAALMSIGFGSAASAAAVIFSDNFNSEAYQLNATLDNWNVTDGTVDVIGAPPFVLAGPGVYLDMDGSTQNAGRITTKASFSAVAGKQYRLSFSYAKNASNPESMSFGFAGWSETLNLPAGGISTLLSTVYTFSAVGTGNFGLFFEGSGADNQGVILDNVELSAVPLPAGGLLLLGGLAALGVLRRRKLVA